MARMFSSGTSGGIQRILIAGPGCVDTKNWGSKFTGDEFIKKCAWANENLGKLCDGAEKLAEEKGFPDQSYTSADKAVGLWDEIRWIGCPRWGALNSTYGGR